MRSTVENDMRVEGYTVAWSVAGFETDHQSVAAWLTDIPGCVVQAPDLETCLERLRELAPSFLAEMRSMGAEIPVPGDWPTVGSVSTTGRQSGTFSLSTSPVPC